MNRRKSREIAMKLLFEISFNKNNCEETIENFKEENDCKDIDFEYVTRIINGVIDNKEAIDKKIEESSNKWKIDRISKTNLSILRLATYEILYENDIPTKVSANEAVELAKSYSEEKSWSFVNGVLGSLINNIENKTV
ncbi:transcription antitermination factor NusB [Clostridium guangxiense]|uniref:transcription antitermination factor NusB n=1 Tax=Clostridium guangxiense TaxID=1662055 RepID=UPI001E6405B2|nr:transcription antitermination factor NusB [Clostridium guangxiense]MCD2345161.1 transcription antitermination factor NusB [Clostridium guangxiense]